MKIYEAEDLPAMNTDLVSTIKTALLGARLLLYEYCIL